MQHLKLQVYRRKKHERMEKRQQKIRIKKGSLEIHRNFYSNFLAYFHSFLMRLPDSTGTSGIGPEGCLSRLIEYSRLVNTFS